jgi:hypothetical protein
VDVAQATDDVSFDCQKIGYTAAGNKLQISGALYDEKFYGPPGYGDTPKIDEKRGAFVVRLDIPLRVYRIDSETAPASIILVKEINLVGDLPPESLSLRGRHVVAHGELDDGWSPFHTRRIIMAVDSLKEGGRVACDGTEQPLK